MAKDVLKLSGDYSIVTASGGEITLSTGTRTGTTRVTGNLIVEGTNTNVSTEQLVIQDNEITINDGETGAGVTLGTAGVRIDRGTIDDATVLWEENASYTLPNGGAGQGIFTFKTGNNLTAIQTHHISTNGDDLILLGTKAPTAKISVRGTTDYELGLTDDDLVNKKYVDDAIQGGVQIPIIRSDNTKVEVQDLQSGDPYSRVIAEVDGILRVEINNQKIILGDLELDGTIIRPVTSGDSLFLESNGSAEVVVRDVLSIEGTVSPTAPAADSGRIKLYAQSEDVGGSGLFFVNTSSTRDELVSKKKALLMGMLF